MSQQPPVGIDLGTTFSVLAYLDHDGRPVSVPNAEGDLTTPSVIYFDGIDVVVGKEALKAATIEPENVAQFAKRDMGNESFSKSIRGEQLPPEVIQSFVLQKLKHDAALKIGPVEKAVITVPAFFNEPRRKATQDAGALAGLEVLDIINEPTAAAIAYGVQEGFLASDASSRQKENILVYDLGGGTFDVTLMSIDGRNYHAIATGGDVYLGGIDWDRRVVDHIAEEYLKKHPGDDPRNHAGGLQRLLRDAEDAKRALTSRTSTTIMFEHHGQSARVPLTREKFDDLTRDLLERTRFTTKHVLMEGKLQWSDITRVLLVGGSTRMVQVGEMLRSEWGKEPDRSLSADEAVAHGAAIYAGLLQDMASGKNPKANVVNVNSHDLSVLGTEKLTGRPRRSVLIPRNTPLPVKSKGTYSTASDNQTSVVVKVIEGGDASGNHSTPIGKCVIQNLPPGLPGGTPVEVLFTYGSNGRLTVQARLPTLNRGASLEIQRASGLTGDQIHDWQRRLNSGGPLTFQ